MICILCLEDCNETINMFTKEGRALNIGGIISKHFWLKPYKSDPVRKSICIPCWLKVEAFHTFYLLVEESHNKLSLPVTAVEDEKSDEHTKHLEEQIIDEEFALNTEDVTIKEEESICQPDSDNFIQLTEFIEQDIKVDWSVQSNQIDPIDHKAYSGSEKDEETAGKEEDSTLKPEPGPSSPTNEEEDTHSDEGDFNGNDISTDSSEESDEEDKKPKRRGRKSSNMSKSKPARKTSEKWQKSLQYDAIIAEHMKLSCVICLEPLPNFDDLKRHFRTKHHRDGYAVCCNKRFTKRGILVDHIKLHLDPESFKCPLCGKNMAHRRTLKGHLDMHAADTNNKIFACDVCPKSFYTLKLLKCHKITHIPEEDRKFKCHDCSKGFGTNYALNNHRRIVHENVNTKICDICGKVIRGKSALRRHQMEHDGIVEVKPPIQCEICGIYVKNRFVLNRHIMAIHAGSDEKHTCEVCGKISPNAVAQKRHFYNVHQSGRQFQCTLCEKAFKNSCALKEHTATHTNEGLYTCPHCPSKFNSKSNMHTHRKKVHPQEWEEARKAKQNVQMMAQQQFNASQQHQQSSAQHPSNYIIQPSTNAQNIIPQAQIPNSHSMATPPPTNTEPPHLPQHEIPLNPSNSLINSIYGVPYSNVEHSPM